jgi:hypothetical protein
MKRIILIALILLGSITIGNAQTKTTYAELVKLNTGWTAVISQKITTTTAPIEHNMVPKMSERLYITPKTGFLFDTHIYAVNYLATLGFKVVEVYQMNGNTCFLLECNKTVTLQVTTDWTNKVNHTINQ